MATTAVVWRDPTARGNPLPWCWKVRTAIGVGRPHRARSWRSAYLAAQAAVDEQRIYAATGSGKGYYQPALGIPTPEQIERAKAWAKEQAGKTYH